MRILHLGHFSRLGGVESLMRTALPVIEQRGHVNIVAYGGHPLEDPAGARRRHHRLAGVDQLGNAGSASVRDLRALIADEQPTVACIHSSIDFRLAGELLNTLPTVFFAHGYGGVCPSGGRWFRYSDTACNLAGVPDARCLVNAFTKGCNTRRPRRLATLYRNTQKMNSWVRSATAVMCASGYVADRYVESGIPRERIAIVPLPSTISTTTLRELAPDDRIVLFAGRLVPQKGVAYLLKAFRLVGGKARLLVCGTGPDLPNLRKLAETLGISESVTFLGECDSMSDLYRSASVVVVPSVWPEPFGLVGPEAMAHGVPVVACRVGGIPEWLSQGNGGFLVEAKDVAQMAERIQALLDDPTLARNVGQIGFEIARKNFSLELFADRFLEVLGRSVRPLAASGR
jgi:glycosyltransferase involved in cell wall biosynthesis